MNESVRRQESQFGSAVLLFRSPAVKLADLRPFSSLATTFTVTILLPQLVLLLHTLVRALKHRLARTQTRKRLCAHFTILA